MSQNRQPGDRQFLLYHAETTLGWRVINRISFERGEAQRERGVYREVYNEAGAHIGYQVVAAQSSPKEFSGASSNSVIFPGKKVMQANAGEMGRSRTARMSEKRREERIHPKTGKRLPPEDFIEKAQIKVKWWMVIPLFNPKHVGVGGAVSRVLGAGGIDFNAVAAGSPDGFVVVEAKLCELCGRMFFREGQQRECERHAVTQVVETRLATVDLARSARQQKQIDAGRKKQIARLQVISGRVQ